MKRISRATCACGCEACYCRASPIRLEVTIAGLLNKSCDECGQLNGVFIVQTAAPHTRCYFDYEFAEPLCVGEDPDDKITHFFVHLTEDGGGNTVISSGWTPCGNFDCPFAGATLVGKANCHEWVDEPLTPAGGGGKCDWDPETKSVTVSSLSGARTKGGKVLPRPTRELEEVLFIEQLCKACPEQKTCPMAHTKYWENLFSRCPDYKW